MAKNLTAKEIEDLNSTIQTCMWIFGVTLILIFIYGCLVFYSSYIDIFLFEPYVPDPSNTKNLVLYNQAANDPLPPDKEQQRTDMIKAAQEELEQQGGYVNNPYAT
uniref:Uncharacterized protein n=1 Tax=viral metagenome TaxID=1070528 RepID=A0A6C0AGA3_9ZZZZ